jgi:hypothetical protein
MGQLKKLIIPISSDLNDKLESKASEMGFSSLNELTRILLTHFANGNIEISILSHMQSSERTPLLIEQTED